MAYPTIQPPIPPRTQVVPELETELKTLKELKDLSLQLQQMAHLRDGVESQVLRYEDCLRELDPADPNVGGVEEQLGHLRGKLEDLSEGHREVLEEYHRHFHSVWGAVMKTGRQTSFFAEQVERFACLYTSHVANLLLTSPNKSYSSGMDLLPHETAVQSSAAATPHPSSSNTPLGSPRAIGIPGTS